MDEPRIIKKYPNRRLYDTEISRYITLDEVKDLVIKRVAFKIVDDRTEDDMTNYVLIQILAQEENGNSPLFTTDILKNLICFYGNPLQKTMSQYLEKGLLMFADPQANLQEYLQHMLKSDPSLNKIATDARHGIDAWSSILAKFLEESPADAVVEKKDNPPPSK